MWYNAGAVFTKLVASLYRTVASTYNLMNDFIEGFKDADIVNSLSAIEENVYILVAVFMLFRITISLLEYLIDPDKSSDKNVGAGKLITRIIVSLLLVVAAQGFLFDWADELESALLADDSILFNLFQLSDEGIAGDSSSNGSCNIKEQYKDGKIKTLEQLKDATIGCKADSNFISELSSVAKSINGERFEVKKLTKSAELEGLLATIEGGSVGSLIVMASNIPEYVERTNSFIQGGSYYYNTVVVDSTTILDLPLGNTNYIILVGNGAYDDVEYDIKDTPGAFFARSVVSSFSNNPSVIKNPTESEEYFLDNSDADDDIAKMVEHDEIQLDAFVCLICGIVMIVLILILCIEVIIRELKLVVLEVFAPIAFISYMNPNDKVLGNWFQKYIGCYLDLFLKLLAIRIGIFLISVVIDAELQFGVIGTILFYIGIFIFIKTLPNLVSDILGIKNMGGTFKESMKGLKTAAGIGAGAIAGGVAGAVSGFGKGGSFSTVAGGLFGGTFRGAQGGAKGKVFQGATTQVKRNSNVKNLNAQGVGWFDRMGGRTGLNNKQEMDRQIAKYKEEASKQHRMMSYAKDSEDVAKKVMEKGKADNMIGRGGKYRKEMAKLSQLKTAKESVTREGVESTIDRNKFYDAQGNFDQTSFNKEVENAYQTARSNATSAFEGQNRFIFASGETRKNAKRDLETLENRKNSVTRDAVEQTIDRSTYYDANGQFMNDKFQLDVDNKYNLLKRHADEEYNTQKVFVDALDNEKELAASDLRQLQEQKTIMVNNNASVDEINKVDTLISKQTKYVNSLQLENIEADKINNFEDDAIAQVYNESTDAEIKTLKETASIQLQEFGVNNETEYNEVKSKGKAAKAAEKVATANATAIENSEHFQNIKKSESLKGGK